MELQKVKTNDVIGVIHPETYQHNNIDDLSFFDFTIERSPIYFGFKDQAFSTDQSYSSMTEIEGKKAVIRTDTNQCLGVHGKAYKLIPHVDMFHKHAEAIKRSSAYGTNIEIVDQLWDGGAKARRTIHFLDHTKKINDNTDVVNMRSDTFNSLDGSFAFQVFSGIFRSLCLNTLVFGGEKFYHSKQKHTANINIGSAVYKIANSLSMYKDNVQQLLNWKSKKVTGQDVSFLFANTITKKKSESFSNIKDALKKEGTELKQLINVKLNDYLLHRFNLEKEYMGSTLYAVYNAVTHWSTHTAESFERENTKGEIINVNTSRKGSNVANVQIEREQKVRNMLDSYHWKELAIAV